MNQVQFLDQHQPITPSEQMQWRVCGLRGATTVHCDSAPAIAQAVDELLNVIEVKNPTVPQNIISVIFSVTPDLTAIFPAAVARQRPGWSLIPLLDVQHMTVANSLERCIRVSIHLNLPLPQEELYPVYLEQAGQLRPDLAHSN